MNVSTRPSVTKAMNEKNNGCKADNSWKTFSKIYTYGAIYGKMDEINSRLRGIWMTIIMFGKKGDNTAEKIF